MNNSKSIRFRFVLHYLCATVLIICGTVIAVYSRTRGQTSTTESTKPCTLDAKICPDGSAVGRQGSKCTYSACPGDPPAALKQ